MSNSANLILYFRVVLPELNLSFTVSSRFHHDFSRSIPSHVNSASTYSTWVVPMLRFLGNSSWKLAISLFPSQSGQLIWCLLYKYIGRRATFWLQDHLGKARLSTLSEQSLWVELQMKKMFRQYSCTKIKTLESNKNACVSLQFNLHVCPMQKQRAELFFLQLWSNPFCILQYYVWITKAVSLEHHLVSWEKLAP